MKCLIIPALAGAVAIGLFAGHTAAQTLEENNEALFQEMEAVHGLTADEMSAVRAIFAASGVMSQGNPSVTKHPMTRGECMARIPGGPESYANAENERICGDKYMAPLYDPATEQPEDATACIDRFEFPNIPCTYPVIWTKAAEAAQVCAAVGKRLCDAHEWEGACAGAVTEADYRFDLAAGVGAKTAVARMRSAHNRKHGPERSWSYGPAFQRGICAQASRKSPGCNGGSFRDCGSNTYPTGAFPNCQSALGVFDTNGNAAEHMNLPLAPDQMASRGSETLGVTEMKGSWFIWDSFQAHQDWCRWRAPFWHGDRVKSPRSHANYHLSFRCCKSRN